MRFAAAITLLVAFLGTCTSQPPPQERIDPEAFRGDLKANRDKWADACIDSYVIEEQASCFCPRERIGPFDVTVVKNEVTQVTFSSSSGLPGTPENPPVITVEETFQRIEDTLNQTPPVAALSVEYDAQYGYITYYFIDQDRYIADEEFGLTFKLLEIISGTPVVPVPSPQPDPNTELQLNRALWAKFRPVVYRYRLRRSCFCDPNFVGPFLVTVANDKVTNVVLEGPPPSLLPPTNIPTIDGLFDIIDDALNGRTKAFKITVQYDPLCGVPKTISIDYIERVVDDEITYQAQLVSYSGPFKYGDRKTLKPIFESAV